MRRGLFFLATFVLGIVLANNCDVRQGRTGQSNVENQSLKSAKIDKDAAIRIATEELVKESRSVTKYDLKAIEEQDAWRVECNLKDLETMGGGVIYFIDKQSGTILKRKYSQ